MSLEERRLERQQRQQVIDIARHPRGAILPPRPDLRRDVVHAQQRQASQATLQAQREAWRIDGQNQARPTTADLGDRLAQTSGEMGQVGHDLGEAEQRQLLHREQAAEASLGHAWPPDA